MGDLTRHVFLAQLHQLLQPKTYLEVGVQHGISLDLAHAAEVAIGIDPNPLVVAMGNQIVVHLTSDEYFANTSGIEVVRQIDLAFIDGMHLFEYALRDFCNIERYCHPGSAVVLDDVLPRNQEEARRMAPGDPVYGDWTGDVWKVSIVLGAYHGDLTYRLVDTQPTGLLVVTGFPSRYPPWSLSQDRIEYYAGIPGVPDEILNRTGAYEPAAALAEIAEETKQWRS